VAATTHRAASADNKHAGWRQLANPEEARRFRVAALGFLPLLDRRIVVGQHDWHPPRLQNGWMPTRCLQQRIRRRICDAENVLVA
jgi:hypothetical protein